MLLCFLQCKWMESSGYKALIISMESFQYSNNVCLLCTFFKVRDIKYECLTIKNVKLKSSACCVVY